MTTVGALDIGGTHVTAGRVDVASALVQDRVRNSLPPGGSRADLLEPILRAAKEVTSPETARFGVAAPGPFDYEAGISKITHKLEGLYGVDLRAELGAALGIGGAAAAFLNDTDAFLLGEWWAGAARGHRRAVGITLGTGLGSAFLAGGRIAHAGAGLPAGGDLYTLAFRGVPVEETISRSALLARYDADPETGVDVEQVADRARGGDDHARLAFHEFASDLAEFLAAPLLSFGPSCLVVGGSIARAWDLLEAALHAGLASFEALVVVPAARIDDAALLGAARYASESVGASAG